MASSFGYPRFSNDFLASPTLRPHCSRRFHISPGSLPCSCQHGTPIVLTRGDGTPRFRSSFAGRVSYWRERLERTHGLPLWPSHLRSLVTSAFLPPFGQCRRPFSQIRPPPLRSGRLIWWEASVALLDRSWWAIYAHASDH